MPAQTPGHLSAQLRDAIARRDELRPGSSAHWRATCEVRTLQHRLVDALDAGSPIGPGGGAGGLSPVPRSGPGR